MLSPSIINKKKYYFLLAFTHIILSFTKELEGNREGDLNRIFSETLNYGFATFKCDNSKWKTRARFGVKLIENYCLSSTCLVIFNTATFFEAHTFCIRGTL